MWECFASRSHEVSHLYKSRRCQVFLIELRLRLHRANMKSNPSLVVPPNLLIDSRIKHWWIPAFPCSNGKHLRIQPATIPLYIPSDLKACCHGYVHIRCSLKIWNFTETSVTFENFPNESLIIRPETLLQQLNISMQQSALIIIQSSMLS